MKYLFIILPLLNSLVCGAGAQLLRRKGASFCTLFYTFLILFVLIHEVFGFLLNADITFITFFDWVNVGTLLVRWEFVFDSLTYVMLCAVIGVSSLVHLYSINYMSQDPRLSLFLSYLSLFTFFMVLLITGSNLLVMIVGWEGVGLCSYLLISFWYTRIQANKAAFKAIIMNRIGDFAFLLGICVTFLTFRTLDFNLLKYLVDSSLFDSCYINLWGYNIRAIDFIGMFLFIGAVGKSAQFGLHIWLPDAMEGPTPVSALIHAATMVTAGIFLMLRCSFFFDSAVSLSLVITTIGALTCIMAATIGLFQYDIKKVIAFSTCSQLGYMVFSIGLENYIGGLYHLFTHAFFKALLFLCAGSVIHALSDEQNMKKMGGLARILPFTFCCMSIGTLALVGMPFFSGHYSKDFILEVAYNNYTVESLFAYTLGNIAVFFTALYSIRLLILTFLVKTNTYKIYLKKIHESPFYITGVLFFLALASIFVGYGTREIFIGLESSFFDDSLPLKKSFDYFDLEVMPLFVKNLPTITAFLGALFGFIFYLGISYNGAEKYVQRYFTALRSDKADTLNLKPLLLRDGFIFFNQRYQFDMLYNRYIGSVVLYLGYNITYKCLDKGLLELFGPTGIYNALQNLARIQSKMHNGFLSSYALLFLGGIFIFLIFFDFYLWS